ncbi:hypothetical protein AB1K54_03445 [Microbacterium sp. BWT-B31]|uniref:hypothetical protein n=1 Tax=Microbacterium sp. BWT-B31 TaxID=3232072 RepID=UPI0035272669
MCRESRKLRQVIAPTPRPRERAPHLSEQSETSRTSRADASAAASAPGSAPSLGGAELRAAQKELAALERRLEKLEQQITAARTALADHDEAGYVGLGAEMARIAAGSS